MKRWNHFAITTIPAKARTGVLGYFRMRCRDCCPAMMGFLHVTIHWSRVHHVISSLPPQKPPGLLGFISIWRCAKTKSTVHGGYNMHSRFLKVAIGTTIKFETNHSSSRQAAQLQKCHKLNDFKCTVKGNGFCVPASFHPFHKYVMWANSSLFTSLHDHTQSSNHQTHFADKHWSKEV